VEGEEFYTLALFNRLCVRVGRRSTIRRPTVYAQLIVTSVSYSCYTTNCQLT